ncbi:MAG: Hpt domain-containing protein, partial [Bdellovibrionales bacterium]
MADSNQSSDFADAFREDALSTLDNWGGVISDAKNSEAEETYSKLMRCAHNLKGNAGLMGFEQFSKAVHRLEDALLRLNTNKVDPKSSQLLTLLYDTEAFLRDWVILISVDPKHVAESFSIIEKIELLSLNPSVALSSTTAAGGGS